MATERGSSGSSSGNAPWRVALVAPLQIMVNRTDVKYLGSSSQMTDITFPT